MKKKFTKLNHEIFYNEFLFQKSYTVFQKKNKIHAKLKILHQITKHLHQIRKNLLIFLWNASTWLHLKKLQYFF